MLLACLAFRFFESNLKSIKVADQVPRRSRRIRGLSPESPEPSSRRRRSDLAGGYHLVTSDVVERDPPQGSKGFIADSGVGSERSVPLTSRVLFPQEEDFQIEIGRASCRERVSSPV